MTDLPATLPAQSGAVVALQADDVEAVAEFVTVNKATSTKRGYQSDFALFTTWCEGRGYTSMPATSEVVAAFLADQARAGIRPSTLARRVAAIRYVHDLNPALKGQPSPTTGIAVREAMGGIRKAKGTRPDRKAAATADRMANMLQQIPADTLRGKRDRALLVLGFAGAFRRSELVALDVADLTTETDGMRVTIRRSKVDQEGTGREIAIPRGRTLRPVKAVHDWLKAAGITSGPVFRSINRHNQVSTAPLTAHAVGVLVKQYAEAAGLDPAEFSGHSLRAGFLTSAAAAGADLFKMMEQSGHRRVETVRSYIRSAKLFERHAGEGFL